MKKLLCAALALTLIFALAACGSDEPGSQGSTPSDLIGPTPEPTPEQEPEPLDSLSICGIDIISGGHLTGLGFSGVEYADGVVTIDGLEIERENQSAPIISFGGGDLEIVVSGECVIETSGGTDGIVASDDSALTITGSGSLSIATEDAVAIDASGAVTISCELTASGETACTSENVSAGEGFALSSESAGGLAVTAA